MSSGGFFVSVGFDIALRCRQFAANPARRTATRPWLGYVLRCRRTCGPRGSSNRSRDIFRPNIVYLAKKCYVSTLKM